MYIFCRHYTKTEYRSELFVKYAKKGIENVCVFVYNVCIAVF